MSQLDDAVARYNKLLETGPHSDLAWAEALHERMESAKLSAGGRLICPFLRPNLITRRQYDSLVKTGESLISAIDRMEQMVLASPALLARLELLPAESLALSMRSCRVSAQARSLCGPVSSDLLYRATASSNWDMLG